MIQLSVAGKNDLPEMANMAEEIWLSYYTQFISLDQIQYMLKKFYSLSSLEEQIASGQEFSFLLEDSKPIGFVSYSHKTDTDYFIHKFYIKTEYRYKKAGSNVLEILNSRFKENSHSNVISIRLTVNRQNYKAINFYFKNGFVIESVEDFDIGNSFFMNDFVMVKTS